MRVQHEKKSDWHYGGRATGIYILKSDWCYGERGVGTFILQSRWSHFKLVMSVPPCQSLPFACCILLWLVQKRRQLAQDLLRDVTSGDERTCLRKGIERRNRCGSIQSMQSHWEERAIRLVLRTSAHSRPPLARDCCSVEPLRNYFI